MKNLRYFTAGICMLVMIALCGICVHADYTEDYRKKLIALHDYLDEQLTAFEKTEETEIYLEFPDFTVAVKGQNVANAIQYNDARKIITMLCGEHPRLISSVNFMSVYSNPNNRLVIKSIKLTRLEIDETYEEAYNAIDQKTDEILAEIIDDGMTELDKAFAVYVYLLNNCEPGTGRYGDSVRDTIYGCITKQKAACGGFSNAYKLFMDKLGIPCEIALSRSMGHIWNYVKIDGKWYHLDATLRNDDDGRLSAERFLVSDEERKKQIFKTEGTEYDWQCIYPEVVCDSEDFADGYLFRYVKDEGLLSLRYNNGEYSFTSEDGEFKNQGLKCMPKLVSLIRSENGNMEFHVTGKAIPYVTRIAAYDSEGRFLEGYDENSGPISSVWKFSMMIFDADNIDRIKIFVWDGMTPLAEVTEIKNEE